MMDIKRAIDIAQVPLRRTSLDMGTVYGIFALCVMIAFAVGWAYARYSTYCFPVV